ncbi:hypothetical protein JOC70_000862 [Clostridium pascui]|uniref:hypothetical protein n=1 Tax=Clostridium pascui TaxID=46609 RepID=UPI001957033E|nr:hypothetical protein [Clostridium pascui]MBM7869393.1 hypothetical protein [Clostridium pascui]
MGVGYVLGCFFSILLWKIDRQMIYRRINNTLKKVAKNPVIPVFFYYLCAVLLCIWLSDINNKEIFNGITAFLVTDISNSERKSLKKREKVHFYDSISIISRSTACGFIAPFLYIMLFGNSFAIIYTLTYNLRIISDLNLITLCFNISTFIPAFIAQGFLYIIYVTRNKKFSLDFKGDYFINSYINPMLNIDILAAYVESVNFYHYFSKKNTSYLKSYGEYKNKIDQICIKDYISISYGICMIWFIIFFLITILTS